MDNHQERPKAPKSVSYFVAPPPRAKREQVSYNQFPSFQGLKPLPPPSRKEKTFLLTALVCICGVMVAFSFWPKFTPKTIKPLPPESGNNDWIMGFPLAVESLLCFDDIPADNPKPAPQIIPAHRSHHQIIAGPDTNGQRHTWYYRFPFGWIDP